MTSTHISLNYHLVFSTKGRRPTIRAAWEERLHSYLGGILRGLGAVAVGIGGTNDHVHILAGLRATHRLADVLRDLKADSSKWLHAVAGTKSFQWQDGYGAFTVSSSVIEAIKEYIRGQKEHHRKRTFQEEYLQLLQENGIDFDEKYLW